MASDLPPNGSNQPISNASTATPTPANYLVVRLTDGSAYYNASGGGGGGTASNFGAAVPASGTAAGFSDGTNMQPARVYDLDTTGSTEYALGVVLRFSGASGSVEAGTATNPLRINPTGTTAQPVTDNGGSLTVDGTVTANAGTGTFAVSAASLPLPTGAATETTLGTRLADSTFTGRINTQGQKAMAASTPVVLASDQSAIPVTDNGGSLTVDGTVTANAGTGTFTTSDVHTTAGSPLSVRLSDGSAFYTAGGGGGGGTSSSYGAAFPASGTAAGFNDGTNMQSARVFDADTGAGAQYVLGVQLRASGSGGSTEIGVAAAPVRVDPTGTTTQPISAASLPLPTGAATETTLGTRLADSTFTGRINTLGQKTMANSTPVVLASDQSTLTISGTVTANVGTGTQPVSGTVTANAGTGPWPVTDNGGSLTVDGTVTANAGTGPWPVTDNGGSLTVDGTITANIGTAGSLALDATLTNRFAALSTAVDGYATLTNTTLTSILAAGGAGVRNYVSSIGLSNTSATPVRVDIFTGATLRHSFYLAASGGGATHTFPFPWRGGDNEAIQAQLSASVTDVRVSITGFRV